MKKPKLMVHNLVFGRARGRWVLMYGSAVTSVVCRLGETKRKFTRRCANLCHHFASPERPISLRIRAIDGRILEERTYPRSADPKRSRG